MPLSYKYTYLHSYLLTALHTPHTHTHTHTAAPHHYQSMKSTDSVNGSGYVRGLDYFFSFLNKNAIKILNKCNQKIDLQSTAGL